jgi:hypothetical protein
MDTSAPGSPGLDSLHILLGLLTDFGRAVRRV